MRPLKFLLMVPVIALALWFAAPASACGDYGCDTGWSGLYSLGDYNLYSFGTDLYGIGSHGGGWGGGYEYGYGGGCGSFLNTCGGGYDYAGLYGSEWGITGYNIDISVYPLPGYDTYGSCGDICSGYNPYMYGMDAGCSIGYCSPGSYYPYYGSDYSSPWNPYYDDWKGYLPTYPNDYYSYYPMPQLPPSYYDFPRDPFQPYPPYTPTWPPVNPPPSIPPYGQCDNITVMCPTGPITRTPQPLPPRYNDLPRAPGTPTSFPPVYYPPTNTHGPGTYPPVSYPPASNPPVYYPPTTISNPPVSNPPTTYPPGNPPTFPPTTFPPVSQPPTATNPIGTPPDQSGIVTNPVAPRRNDIPRG